VPNPKALAPAKSPRTQPAPRVENMKGYVEGTTHTPMASAKSPRPVANPKKKQATYPGRKPYNYAV
jgi:hypothetical protein